LEDAKGYPSVFDCSSPITALPSYSSKRTDSKLQFFWLLLRTDVGPNPAFLLYPNSPKPYQAFKNLTNVCESTCSKGIKDRASCKESCTLEKNT